MEVISENELVPNDIASLLNTDQSVHASTATLPRSIRYLAVFFCFGLAIVCLDSSFIKHFYIVQSNPKEQQEVVSPANEIVASLIAPSTIVNVTRPPIETTTIPVTTTMTPTNIKTTPIVTTTPQPSSTNAPSMIVSKPKLLKRDASPFTPKKLRLVTLADNPTPGICLISSVIYQQGYVLEVLGWNYSTHFFDGTNCGEGCQDIRNNRYGQQKKLHWMAHYLEHANLDDDDLFLFTDAWDVIVQDNINRLPELFLRHTDGQRGVIFNGEPTCGDSFRNGGSVGDQLRAKGWPIRLEEGQEPRGISGSYMCDAIAAKTASNTIIPGPNWSLGSGGILGDVRSTRAFLRRVSEVRLAQEKEYAEKKTFLFEGDQILFQIAYLMYPEINVKIDAAAEIFFVISYYIGPKDFNEFKGSASDGCTAKYNNNGTPSAFSWNGVKPIFFHFPGAYKHMFQSCASAAAVGRRSLAPGKYFLDVDRQVKVLVSKLCPDYT